MLGSWSSGRFDDTCSTGLKPSSTLLCGTHQYLGTWTHGELRFVGLTKTCVHLSCTRLGTMHSGRDWSEPSLAGSDWNKMGDMHWACLTQRGVVRQVSACVM